MLNLAHVMTAEDRRRGFIQARSREISASAHDIFCTAEDFLRIMSGNCFKLCADNIGIIGDVVYSGPKNRRGQWGENQTLPGVEIFGNLRFERMVFHCDLDLSLVTVRGALQFVEVTIGRNLIVPENFDQIIISNDPIQGVAMENFSVLGKKLQVIYF